MVKVCFLLPKPHFLFQKPRVKPWTELAGIAKHPGSSIQSLFGGWTRDGVWGRERLFLKDCHFPHIKISQNFHNMRKIIHIDMDAFYAAVEQRDNPELRGKPVIVGGRPDSRGVVATASYEARKFGVHSAMSSSHAYRLCPHGIFVPPRFDVYKEASNQIREIFHEYTNLVEPLSLDEAYLDVTENKAGQPSATVIAREIKRQIRERTGLTASAGVSFTKFLAKVASDMNKPDGLTVITPDRAPEFIDKLPVEKFHGIGKVTAGKMRQLGIKTGADLKKYDRFQLHELFGKSGAYYYAIAHAEDDSPVEPDRGRKSVGREVTLDEDITDRGQMLKIIGELAGEVERRLKRHGLEGRTITLKVKYHDFRHVTRAVTVPDPTASAAAMLPYLEELLKQTDAGAVKVRLLGVTVSNFSAESDPEITVYQPELPLKWE